nr:MAG TPA: nucleoid-associated protein [Caudoviricetes sp.]
MAETNNTLTLKFDKETTLPLLEGLGKSAYAIAVAHGFKGSEQDWLDSLRGPKGDPGDKGDPLKFSDLTPEQLNALKGKKGDPGNPGSAEKAAELLKNKNVYLPDASVGTVLAKLVEILGDTIHVEFKQLEYFQPVAGQEFLDLKGEPHFKVSVNGGEKRVFESDNMRVPIKAFGEDDIRVSYFDLADREVGVISIKGLETTVADDTYTDATGAKFTKFGKKLVLKLADYNGNSFNWLGKWTKSDIDVLEINSDISKSLVDRDETAKKYDGLTFIIKNPNNIILHAYTNQGVVNITTAERSMRVTLFEHLEWNGGTYESEHL